MPRRFTNVLTMKTKENNLKPIKTEDIEDIRLSGYDAIKNTSDVSRTSAMKKLELLKQREKKMIKTVYKINDCEVTVYGKILPLSILNKLNN